MLTELSSQVEQDMFFRKMMQYSIEDASSKTEGGQNGGCWNIK